MTKNNKADREELLKLLADADVGNFMTRGELASGMMKEVDADKDGSISWIEFEQKLKSG